MCGVSTKRDDQLVESLGLRISKSEVKARLASESESHRLSPGLGNGEVTAVQRTQIVSSEAGTAPPNVPANIGRE